MESQFWGVLAIPGAPCTVLYKAPAQWHHKSNGRSTVKRQLSLRELGTIKQASQPVKSIPELPWPKPTRAFCCPKAGIRTHSWEWQKHIPSQSLKYPFQQQGYCKQALPCLQLWCKPLLVCTIWKQGMLLKLFYTEEMPSSYQEWLVVCPFQQLSHLPTSTPHAEEHELFNKHCSSSALFLPVCTFLPSSPTFLRSPQSPTQENSTRSLST